MQRRTNLTTPCKAKEKLSIPHVIDGLSYDDLQFYSTQTKILSPWLDLWLLTLPVRKTSQCIVKHCPFPGQCMQWLVRIGFKFSGPVCYIPIYREISNSEIWCTSSTFLKVYSSTQKSWPTLSFDKSFNERESINNIKTWMCLNNLGHSQEEQNKPKKRAVTMQVHKFEPFLL